LAPEYKQKSFCKNTGDIHDNWNASLQHPSAALCGVRVNGECFSTLTVFSRLRTFAKSLTHSGCFVLLVSVFGGSPLPTAWREGCHYSPITRQCGAIVVHLLHSPAVDSHAAPDPTSHLFSWPQEQSELSTCVYSCSKQDPGVTAELPILGNGGLVYSSSTF
jgi:hypothetical protein